MTPANQHAFANLAELANRSTQRHVLADVNTTIDPNPGAGERTVAADDRSAIRLVVISAAGAIVALAIGTYGRVHNPTGQGIETFGFDAVLPMKAWLTTGAFALALVQLITALRIYGRLPMSRTMPAWLPAAHRWSGALAFLLTLPVAYHCLWALGFQSAGTRQLMHAVLGCAFYGAFATKMLALRSQHLPRWALPVLGGGLVALLTGLWLTSSLWFFTNVGFPGT